MEVDIRLADCHRVARCNWCDRDHELSELGEPALPGGEGRLLWEGEDWLKRDCHKCGKPNGEVLLPCYCRMEYYGGGVSSGMRDDADAGLTAFPKDDCRHCKGSGNRWMRADFHSCIRVLQKRVKELKTKLAEEVGA
jgi:hypothetical protein